jgi:high-affinity Fe2+/Pb2+ permease
MRLFFTIASILIMVAAAGMLYMAMETEKYWREENQRPPAKS